MKKHTHAWTRRATGVSECKTCGTFRVRTTRKDPDTGKMRDVQETMDEGATLGQAIDRVAALKKEVDGGQANQARPSSRPLVSQYAPYWLDSKVSKVASGRLKKSTVRLYGKVIDQRIIPEIGGLYVDAIRRFDVQRLVDKWAEQYAASTVTSWTQGVLFPLLKDAAIDYDISDPTQRVELHGQSGWPDQEALSPEGVAALLAAITDQQRLAEVEALLWTGMRVGELFALCWVDVDLPRGVLTISQRVYRGELASPKSGKGRTIPLPARLVERLEAWRKAMLKGQHVGLSTGLVFPSTWEKATYRTNTGLGDFLRPLADVAKVGRLTPHTLRHTYTTRLRQVAPDHVVQAIVGHTSKKQTDHYTHLTDGDLISAIAGLEEG